MRYGASWYNRYTHSSVSGQLISLAKYSYPVSNHQVEVTELPVACQGEIGEMLMS